MPVVEGKYVCKISEVYDPKEEIEVLKEGV